MFKGVKMSVAQTQGFTSTSNTQLHKYIEVYDGHKSGNVFPTIELTAYNLDPTYPVCQVLIISFLLLYMSDWRENKMSIIFVENFQSLKVTDTARKVEVMNVVCINSDNKFWQGSCNILQIIWNLEEEKLNWFINFRFFLMGQLTESSHFFFNVICYGWNGHPKCLPWVLNCKIHWAKTNIKKYKYNLSHFE